MLKKIVLLCGCLFLSWGTWAAETKIIGFEQVFNLDQEHSYEVELGNLNPASQIWTALYLVGVPKTSGSSASKLDFVIAGEGLLDKSHPTQPAEIVTLEAQNLQMRVNYSLKDFDDLTDEIENQTDKKIQDPILTDSNNVRVYGKIWDWIPEYNLNKPAKVSFGVANVQDFDIKAAYLIVGEGEKTPQLLKLDIQQKIDSEQVQQSFKEKSNSFKYGTIRVELKFLIFFTILAVSAILNWRKLNGR